MQKRWICDQISHTYLMLNLKKEQTGYIITFTLFEGGELLSEPCDNTESVNEFYGDLTLPTLISEE